MSAEDAAAGGLFLEAVDGHYGKELIDGPGIGHGLEDGVVAEVGVGEHGLRGSSEFITHVSAAFLEDA